MSEINNLLDLDWRGFIYTTFLIMACLIAIHKVSVEFIALVKKTYNKIKGIDSTEKNKYQDLEIDKIKARQDAFEDKVDTIREGMMIALWDRIVHFGLNYVKAGHISYAEKDIFLNQCASYKKCGGNGHLVNFVPLVEQLPYTEELTEEQRKVVENDFVAKQRRVALAEASLSSYYSNN